MERKEVSLFVPVLNEGETIGNTLRALPEIMQGYSWRLVAVDDGSTDDSVGVVRQFGHQVISLGQNRGVGVATKVGLSCIALNYPNSLVVKFDGDGQHDIRLIPEVLGLLEENRAVVCSRFHPLSDQSYTPMDRILLNLIFSEMVKRVTGWTISDARSGFMGFYAEDLRVIAPKLIVELYGIPMELLIRLWGHNPEAKVQEIPHPALYRTGISEKLDLKYSRERLKDQSSRLQVAYEALLMVLEDMGVSREHLLHVNGFSKVQ